MPEIKTTPYCFQGKSGCRETKSKRTFQGYLLKKKECSAPTPPQVAQDDINDAVEDEEWLQQVDEVYDKLSVQHSIYYDSYNLWNLEVLNVPSSQELTTASLVKLSSSPPKF